MTSSRIGEAGFFVDVGANHYRTASKTYYLETDPRLVGHSRRAAERICGGLREAPAAHAVLPAVRVQHVGRTAKLYVLSDQSSVASSNETFVREFGDPDEVRSVPTVALTDLLDASASTGSTSCRWTSSCTNRRR